MVQHPARRVLPATPAAGDGRASRLVRAIRRQRVAEHALGLAAVAICVMIVGAAASLHLANVGVRTCESRAGDLRAMPSP